MVRWFCDEAAHRGEDGLTLCRVKNKFARSAEAEDGYRDVSLSLLFSHASGLRVVGEVPSLSTRVWFLIGSPDCAEETTALNSVILRAPCPDLDARYVTPSCKQEEVNIHEVA